MMLQMGQLLRWKISCLWMIAVRRGYTALWIRKFGCPVVLINPAILSTRRFETITGMEAIEVGEEVSIKADASSRRIGFLSYLIRF